MADHASLWILVHKHNGQMSTTNLIGQIDQLTNQPINQSICNVNEWAHSEWAFIHFTEVNWIEQQTTND